MKMKYWLAWLPMVFIAIANGILRESTYGRHLSELRARQISTVILLVLFGLYIWGISRLWRFSSARQALTVGLVWLLLTVAFEFGFGLWIAGHPWHKLLHDYNLAAGRLWMLVLGWVAIGPWFFYRPQHRGQIKPPASAGGH
jgi:hypothetical protein